MSRLDPEASQVLREAFDDRIVQTVLRPFSGRKIPLEMYHWVISEAAKKSNVQNANQFDLLQHPKSLRCQESRFDVATQPDMSEYWAIELAQFAVPQGHIGYLTGLEQVINDVDGNFYPSSKEYWGSPHFIDTDVNACRWFLTLDFYDGRSAEPFAFTSAVVIDKGILPGMSYSELPEIDALWYPAHSPASNDIRMLVPGARMLRFFFLTPPTHTYQWQVRGRLRGYTQSTFSDEASHNARTID